MGALASFAPTGTLCADPHLQRYRRKGRPKEPQAEGVRGPPTGQSARTTRVNAATLWSLATAVSGLALIRYTQRHYGLEASRALALASTGR